jgi:hypothetical protein
MIRPQFSLDAFANDTERWLAGALAGVFLLAMATAGVLCYSCCAQTHGIIRASLLIQAVVLLSVCGIFALYRRDKLPAAAEVSPNHAAVFTRENERP